MTTLEQHRECGKDAELNVISDETRTAVNELATWAAHVTMLPSDLSRGEQLAKRAALALDSAYEVTTDCPFSGTVEVRVQTYIGWQTKITWTCPVCGFEHEEVE